MSPEPSGRGLAIDRRADVFALGAVLHEMLTGERLFRGGTRTWRCSPRVRSAGEVAPRRRKRTRR